MKIDLLGIFFLFSTFQAFVLLIGINLRKPLYSDLKKITSFLLLDILIVTLYYFTALNSIHTHSMSVLGSVAWMSLCPLFYLLVKAICVHDWQLATRNLIYFIVPFIFLLEGILATMGINIWQPIKLDSSFSYLDLWMLLFFTSAGYFLVRSLLLFQVNVAEEKNTFLKWFTILFSTTVLTYAVLYAFIRTKYTIIFELTLIALLGIFVFILIYRVFRILSFQKFFDLKNPTNRKSSQELKSLAFKLEKLMEEKKPYLNTNLSLSGLSDLSAIKPTELSNIFSYYYNSSFYEFINRYRVDHLEKLILNDENAHYKISALAEQSGFRSKATFYKAFKAKHQLTPLQFIKKQKK